MSSPAAGGTDGSRPPTTVKTALVTGHVFVITIDRPEKRNCVDPNTAQQLVAAFQAFEANKDARVAILTGSGGTFCAGFDLKFLSSADKDDLRSVLENTPHGVGPMVRSLIVIHRLEHIELPLLSIMAVKQSSLGCPARPIRFPV